MSQTMADLFKYITTGVHVIGVADGEQRNAFTAAWVMPVAFRPLLLGLSINPRHLSYGLLQAGRGFSVNVLGKDQLDLAAHFGLPAQPDKLAAIPWRSGMTGAPLLAQALARFECELFTEHPAGDHVLVLGRVIHGETLDSRQAPLLYRDTGDLDGASSIYPDDFSGRP